MSCLQSYVAEHNPGFAAHRTHVAEAGELESWQHPLLLASVMYAVPHLPCCASTVWQVMLLWLMCALLEIITVVFGVGKVIAKSVRAGSTLPQVGQGKESWGVDLSAAEQNQPSMIENIEVDARRSVCGKPTPAHALAPQPLPHVL